MRRLWVLLLLAMTASAAHAAKVYRQVVVADPYLEMHTGPGKGYPVFFVVGRGDKVEILKQRTDWYLVREHQGREGWVKEQDMLATLETDGSPVKIEVPTLENLAKRRFEGAVMLGDFGGASLIALSASYGLSDHLSVELVVAQALGNISNSEFVTLDLTHTMFPEKRFSPYFNIGTGKVHNAAHTTQVQNTDSTDQMSFIGVGARYYLTRRFIARGEYHANHVYTSRNENEDIKEWKVGFAFFF